MNGTIVPNLYKVNDCHRLAGTISFSWELHFECWRGVGVSSNCGLLWENGIQLGQIPGYTEIGGKRLVSAAATISHGTDLMLEPEPEE